ncbi:MAG: LPXTG cell wall anchor domain-containing protein [Clostridiales bacterium]|nr:LPXTG cell wall anchor domain-containing protein [Clostridiales bacterium]
MYVRKKLHGLMAAILALMMCVAMLPAAAFATEDTTTSSKTLTVDASATEVEGETYTTIQAAINYIYALDATDDEDAKDDWTITVKSGTYTRFVVLSYLDGLTIQAADGATVTVTTLDGSTVEGVTYNSGYYDIGGIMLRDVDNVTFKGLTFKIVDNYAYYYNHMSAAITTYNENGNYAQNLTVDSCHFVGSGDFTTHSGSEYGYTYGSNGNTGISFGAGIDSITITNCSFADLCEGIRYQNDNADVSAITVTNNTFTNCAFAIHGYCGERSSGTNDGIFTFTGNTVTGTSDIRSKVYFEELKSSSSSEIQDSFTLTVSSNKFAYVTVGLVNLTKDPISAESVLANNEFDDNSFVVEGTKVSVSGAEITSVYSSDEDSVGYWELTNAGQNLVSLNGLTEEQYAAVVEAVNTANEEGSHVLTFENINTFTWLKDCIYWVSGTMPTEKEDLPGLDKTIVLDDGSEVEQDDVAAGDTVNYKLTSNVPSTLSDYITYAYDEESSTAVGTVNSTTTTDDDGNEVATTDTYVLTFHDSVNSALTVDTNSIEVYIGNTLLVNTDEVTYYTLTTSGLEDDCTFEVSMDLLALYTAGVINEANFGKTSITVTYSATLDEDASAGAYTNTAWVSYLDKTSEQDQVEVDTYGISIFKYDQSDSTTDDEGNTTYTGLAGATFELRIQVSEDTEGALTDSEGNSYIVVTTLTSGEDGYVTYEGLDAGTYYLVETAAPEGYVKADTILTIEITDDIDAEAGTYLAYVEFANAPIPSTGGAGTTMYTVVGVCIILLAGAALVVTRKNRREE